MSNVEYRGDKSSFIEMGRVLYHNEKAGLTLREGQIFEAKTVKGGKNLIVLMRVVDPWMIYMHGDKAKKIDVFTFINAVMDGTLEPKMPKQVDANRMSLALIGIDAIANRRTAEQHIDLIGEEAEAALRNGGFQHDD